MTADGMAYLAKNKVKEKSLSNLWYFCNEDTNINIFALALPTFAISIAISIANQFPYIL
jgi:hypothetical protein